jgi:hypothetical protein
MIVEFFGPFEKLAEKRLDIPLNAPTRLEHVLRMLSKRYPGFARYCRMESDAALNAHVTIIRNGQPVKLADKIDNKDKISILLPVTGG